MSASLGGIAPDVGKGLFAGAAGTAAMTVSSTLEMTLSGRGASQTPVEAAEARFSNLVHWGYRLGRCAGFMASAGLPGPLAIGLAYSYLDRSQSRQRREGHSACYSSAWGTHEIRQRAL